MLFASEASLEVHEGIVDEQGATQVQTAAIALASPFRAFDEEQSGSFVFIASLIVRARSERTLVRP